MSTSRKLSILVAMLVVAGTTTASVSEPPATPPMTQADHASAAAAYEAEAKEARQKAASHELMASRYRNTSASQKGLNVPTTAMASHCEKLAGAYEQAGVEASALADLHRAAAGTPE